MKTYYIYVLADPRDYSVKYVGCTLNLKRRLKQHIGDAHKTSQIRSDNARIAWLRQLIVAGYYPMLAVVDKCGEGEQTGIEQAWIGHFLKTTDGLTNTNHNPDIATSRKTYGTPTYKRIAAHRLEFANE